MFPYHFLAVKNMSQGLIHPGSSAQQLEPQSWHYKVWALERRKLCLSLFLKVEDGSHKKMMEILTPKGLFIGSPSGLK